MPLLGLTARYRHEEAKEFDFWPSTYVLPGDYALFVEVCACTALPRFAAACPASHDP